MPKQEPHPGAALLDALLCLDVGLALVREEIQRCLYAALGREVSYSRPREELTLRVVTPDYLIDSLASFTRELYPWDKRSGARTAVLAPDHGTKLGIRVKSDDRVLTLRSAPGRGPGTWEQSNAQVRGAELAIESIVQLKPEAF
ncbi:hypothetical protein HHX38_04915 [Streptomyces sp. PKU-MA01144]|uniref:hypothetical protein n=1 Tax=Streptomyces sp. PKU-MA01144 TaxID=2729138 RepID=UPI00147C037E|nr:hypothetical protein [Streptomyces sp. PKU-MA01144]NNJ03478.1 hypothetical protein [Streptomyces sp. PKU-MA01144]